MTKAYDELEPLISGDDVDDDVPKTDLSSTPYDNDFHSCADRLFDAISCRCKTSLEIRLRLGTFRSKSPAHDDRSLDILLQCKDQTEQFWLTICAHSPLRCM
jgi:hypothetical protein